MTLVSRACGALSVPRKNLRLPPVAACSTARRCFSLFRMGRQKEWGCRPPCHTCKQHQGTASEAAGCHMQAASQHC